MATSGWVLDGAEIEKWCASVGETEQALPDKWLQPAGQDDASWMLPFSTRWGSDQSWLVYARAEPADVKKSLLNLRNSVGGKPPLVPSLAPAAIADFLANQAGTSVQRFFSPLDAILIEVHAGERWALFGRRDLEACMRELNFVPQPQW
jgi:hypothetical protein